nr:MAG TPA: hypothetical protein [Caudoviricetes sp.]
MTTCSYRWTITIMAKRVKIGKKFMSPYISFGFF